MVKQKYSVVLGYKLYILLSHVAAYKVAADVGQAKVLCSSWLRVVYFVKSCCSLQDGLPCRN